MQMRMINESAIPAPLKSCEDAKLITPEMTIVMAKIITIH